MAQSVIRLSRDATPTTGDAPPSNTPTQADADGAANDVRGDTVPLGMFALGRFEVLRRIGAGGMGLVYEAFDPDLERRVALKVISKGPDIDGSEGRTQLLNEARAAAQLNHPNVVTVYEVGLLEDQVFIVMELVRSGSLDRWLVAEPRPLGAIVEMLVQSGRGLACAHAAGLIHRDFKPANVLVGEDGRARVADFGLVHWLGPDSQVPAGAQGTPGYMAPEQYLGEKLDARADQFSFCVALFEALCGHLPFDGETHWELMSSVLEGQIDWRDSTPPDRLRQILTRGLSVRVDERYPTMSVLLSDLVAFLDYERARVGQACALVDGAAADYARGRHIEARAKLRSSLEEQDSLTGRALWARIRRDPIAWRIEKTVSFACAIRPHTSQVMIAPQSGALHFIDMRTTQRRIVRLGLQEPQRLVETDDHRIIAATDVRGRVALYDTESRQTAWLDAHQGFCGAAQFVPKTRRLVTGGQDGRICVWKSKQRQFDVVESGPVVLWLDVCGDGTVVWQDSTGDIRIAPLREHANVQLLARRVVEASTVAFAAEGEYIIGPAERADHLQVWRRRDDGSYCDHVLLRGHQHRVRSFAVAPMVRRWHPGTMAALSASGM